MLPMPEPTPPRAITARPAPTSLPRAVAAVTSMIPVPLLSMPTSSVMQVDRIVQVDAGQDGEHISLQERDAELEAGQRHDEGERRPAAEHPERNDEAAEDLQHRMAGHHVGEQSHR